MQAKDIPIGRIAKYLGGGGTVKRSSINLYLFKTYGNVLFKFWPDNKATLEAATPRNEEWEVELLPVGTQVTFTFDGVSWSRPDDYHSEYDDK